MTVLYDSVTLDTVPADAQALAGYTSGNWPTFEPMRARWPKLAKAGRIISIAVNDSHDADCLDAEPGDASPAQAPAWVERQLARGLKRPIVYASLSNYPQVLSALNGAGIHRTDIRVWTAHYNSRAHLCTPGCGFGFNTTADATQWTDRALDRNLDQSLCGPAFFATTPKPNRHYDWYFNEPAFKERDAVEAYDKLRNRAMPFVVVHRKQLGVLRTDLHKLAERVAHEAITHPEKNGHPSWGQFHRGFRYQGLIRRAEGQRIE